ncbi:hypothetical protein N7471_009896 [Penicillium samsonianum]|uniref:uncharacterized protein n=1 Tax=Penicillium samsonianum TaxID=1882272 RepID=UPI0025485365|nr:uncharacterized protein N7471_009896 [Penicillium samsonianum]KAJ6128679.1 hypothetical protein N7471_009896 [Penicillium samsonianum]
MSGFNRGYQAFLPQLMLSPVSIQPIKALANRNKLPAWEHVLGSLVRFAGDYHEEITRNPLDQNLRSMTLRDLSCVLMLQV